VVSPGNDTRVEDIVAEVKPGEANKAVRRSILGFSLPCPILVMVI
jgi:hypothetical protein